jgi:hypothetical protein
MHGAGVLVIASPFARSEHPCRHASAEIALRRLAPLHEIASPLAIDIFLSSIILTPNRKIAPVCQRRATTAARSVAQVCAAATGWDGPTGNGTPNGVGGF